ncbi:MAG: response regulator transcription factor [Sphingobacteriales bacterium]|nr:response regulator transcription factor [Sphingobacteriales bacterium]
MKRIKIYLIDDQRLMLDMWNSLLSIDSRFSITGVSTDGRQAIREIKVKGPDVVIIDVSMPEIPGVELVRAIKEKAPGVQVLAVSMFSHIPAVRQILSAGASGFISRASSFEEMIRAIIAIHNGTHYIAGDIKDQLAERMLSDHTEDDTTNRVCTLTRRELEIISMIREGLSSHDIAGRLEISQRTVEVHRYNIFKKLNVSNVISMMRVLNQEAV